jgi:hypothetical protein
VGLRPRPTNPIELPFNCQTLIYISAIAKLVSELALLRVDIDLPDHQKQLENRLVLVRGGQKWRCPTIITLRVDINFLCYYLVAKTLRQRMPKT